MNLLSYYPIFLPLFFIITYLIVINHFNKKLIKPNTKLTYISEDLVKITLYRKNAFSLGNHSYNLFWKRMIDNNTGQYLFFNNNCKYIINCEAQEELEKHIIDNKFII
jgi:hypothetical protein